MYGNIPKETLAELLLFINEKEDLDSIRELGTVSRQDLKVAIEALARELQVQAIDQGHNIELGELKEIKDSYRKILSSLNEREKKLLIKGLIG